MTNSQQQTLGLNANSQQQTLGLKCMALQYFGGLALTAADPASEVHGSTVYQR